MGFFKKVIIFVSVGANFLFAFSASPKVVPQNEYLLLKDKSEACHNEIEEKIKNILDISKLKISKQTFADSSYLYLTNQKQKPFEDNNPMQGDVNANLIFLLHKNSNSCYISLVDEKNKILKSLKLKECSCQKVKKE